VATDVHRFGRAANDAASLGGRAFMIVFGPFCIAHFLVAAGKCVVEAITFLQADWFSRCGGTCRTTREIDELNVAYNTKAGDCYYSLSPAYSIIPYIGKHWLVRRAA